MNDKAAVLVFFVVGMVVCFGVSLLLIVGGGALIFFLGRQLGAQRQKQMEGWAREWAEENGYELIQFGAVDPHESPIPRELIRERGVGVVRSVEVQDQRGRKRFGWMFFKARRGGRGYSGFIRESLEVAWDEEAKVD